MCSELLVRGGSDRHGVFFVVLVVIMHHTLGDHASYLVVVHHICLASARLVVPLPGADLIGLCFLSWFVCVVVVANLSRGPAVSFGFRCCDLWKKLMRLVIVWGCLPPRVLGTVNGFVKTVLSSVLPSRRQLLLLPSRRQLLLLLACA